MSVKQSYIDRINANVAAANALNYDDYINAAKNKNAANKQADIDTINAGDDSQIENTKAAIDKQIGDTKAAYEAAYQKNAVQKLINEKQIAERNANLGLTDSGLNRTQQTAAQLSYANQKGNIDVARQGALDELGLQLTDAVTTLQNQKASDVRNAENQWDTLSTEQGANAYNTQLNYYNDQIKSDTEALTDIEKNEQETALELEKARIAAESGNNDSNNKASLQKIYWFRGVSDESGRYIYYNTETGKTEEIPAYMNPYTSNDNRIAYAAEYKNKNIGFFNLADGTPGYQPRGLESEGGKFMKVETTNGKPLQFDLYGNGKYNTVWYSPSGHYWVWDDLANSYKNMDSQVKAYLKQTQ